jgi:hypothetical protein
LAWPFDAAGQWVNPGGRTTGRLRVARYVGPGELRFELVYLASCYPCYGRDVAGRIARCHVCPHRQANGP